MPGSTRIAALLIDRRGWPIGFVKITEGPRSTLAMEVDRAIAVAPPEIFVASRAPADGQLVDVNFRVLTPLPEGATGRPNSIPIGFGPS